MRTVNNIQVVYNEVILVLKCISLTVPEDGVVALQGANGVGKRRARPLIKESIILQSVAVTIGDVIQCKLFMHSVISRSAGL